MTHEKSRVKQAARGHWPRILTATCGIKQDILDGKNHPCPKCGGKDRFRFTDIDGDGSCLCNKCFKKGNGDGFAAVRWLANTDFNAAVNLVADCLHLTEPEHITSPAGSGAARPVANGRGGVVANGRGGVVAKYSYRSETGELLFQVVRFAPKDFRQCKPKPGGGWIWSIKGVQVVPYRLPELLADPTRPVFIVEGEKDADGLAALGVLATCNAGGAGKWKDEHSEFLRGRRVVILADNDEPGRQHAEQVAQSLHGVAETIRIVELPGLPLKGDASDWIAAGGTRDQLKQLAKASPVWAPGEQPWPEIVPFDDLELPKFPTAALPGALRQWVEAESHATQTPADLAGLLALSVCSVGIARRVEVEPRPGWREPVNLFTAILLEPGNRKSAVFADAMKPLRELEAELIEVARPIVARDQSDRRQDEARLRRLEKLAAEKGDAEARHEAGELAADLAEKLEPALPRLVVDDVTGEKLGMMLAQQDGRIASMSPEGGVFDLMAGLYSKSGIPQFGVYLMGHSGDDLVTDRVGRKSVHVERPALTCAYAMQPQVIEGLAENAAFRGRGLLARFLYAAPESWIGRRQIASRSVPEEVREAYRSIVRSLVGEGECVLRLTADAQTSLRAWEGEVEGMLADGGELEAMRDWGAKLAGATLRLAAVLHCVEFGTAGTINRRTIVAAIAIARYLIPHAEAVLNLMQASGPSADDDAHYVLSWIERHGRTQFTRRDAHQDGRRRFCRVEDIDPPLAELVRRGYIRQSTATAGRDGTPGRPSSPLFDVNPAVFDSENPGKRTQYPQNPSFPTHVEGFEQPGEGVFGNSEDAEEGIGAPLRSLPSPPRPPTRPAPCDLDRHSWEDRDGVTVCTRCRRTIAELRKGAVR